MILRAIIVMAMMSGPAAVETVDRVADATGVVFVPA